MSEAAADPAWTKIDEVLAAHERIGREDADLGSFVHVAEASAVRREAERAVGPLRGIALGVKDIFDTADMPTAYGSRVYDGHRPRMDAAIVAALRSAGAVVLGKTATTEFAAWPPARTVNPRNPAHTPGGSSAGSAAAVAAGLVPLAIGTQTLGSVIRPASFCGIVGFKPSYGRLSRAGFKPLAESLDTIGFFAPDVGGVSAAFHAVSGRDEALPRPAGRLAFWRGETWDLVTPDAAEAVGRCLDDLRARGFPVEEIDTPPACGTLRRDGKLVHDFEMSRGLLAERRAAPSLLSPSMLAGIDRGLGIGTSEHGSALSRLEEGRLAFREVAARYDAILSLAANGEAPFGLGSTGDSAQNVAWTALHVPCITLPLMTGASGLPIGLQVAAGRFKEGRLLGLAARIERAFASVDPA